MKYFIDTEFLEGTQTKRWFGMPCWFLPNNQTKPTIDLISIGIVSEDGREYYAISKDFNLKEAWNRWQQRTGEGDRNNIQPRLYWIRENVLKPIFNEFIEKEYELRNTQERILGYSKPFNRKFTYKNFKKLLEKYGKTNKQIAKEIYSFIEIVEFNKIQNFGKLQPQFYAYYADYDWVVFCWLFGKMVDLPKGFPKYCIDLKQELERKRVIYGNETQNRYWIPLEERLDYPKQTNEHSALDDARWNKKLYEFLKTL